ncbi:MULTISPECIES: Ig-like domain-containing protein [unclassified Streptomyces]|uniref:L,D-transpeptidase n=1 Tax=unclassified Streptomyces TaxID=2593676 RepID=UPI000223B3E2|nr:MULTISPECIES: Ig-like domain-containing protein [unclassified Streptomyces]MYR69867.1 L,D-transpeptidase family protein [Streptomyces sp. SID4939]MYS00220.1 L,D-transpeptidase family protein [Streptomyces sp. SID4940]MYT62983.1 L,D-transpeptidase family protein [Streptomyces sp. SID8357]MYT88741.1 L,D-transpeptidase family protein [Streptomyces sp. SID8360]MYW39931.1 L,D-transpeptidase family protein [Streptomyces sp. SID1]
MNHEAKRARAGSAAVLTWAGLFTVLAVLTGCTQATSFFGDGRAPGDAIRIVPKDGAENVGADDRIEVTVPDGRLERVKVTRIEDAEQEEVPGKIAGNGRSWAPEDKEYRLGLAGKYSVEAVAVDGDGRRSARSTTFTTLVPKDRFIGYFKPENRSTVGTGMIVSFDFNRPVRNRAAVEKAIRITTEPQVEVVGHWFGTERLDFRPAQYWEPGTEVTVDVGLRDVEGAPGVYGSQRKKVTFRVGRSQTSVVDAAAHTMEVRRDGEVVSTVPITAGAEKTTTYNGKMVVSELHEVTRMDGRTVGFGGEYDIKDVPHAIRLTKSGTFLHGNYWESPDIFGSDNTSHGCIGLRDIKGGSSDTPAGWFFERTLVGDVVEVVNSTDKTVAPDNGLSGWNLGWPQWKAGSALR